MTLYVQIRRPPFHTSLHFTLPFHTSDSPFHTAHFHLHFMHGFSEHSLKPYMASDCISRHDSCILAGLTLHADPDIRAQAMSVMKRILRGLPRLRNAMLLGLAGLAARIPDDTPEVLMPTTPLHAGQPCFMNTLMQGYCRPRRCQFLPISAPLYSQRWCLFVARINSAAAPKAKVSAVCQFSHGLGSESCSSYLPHACELSKPASQGGLLSRKCLCRPSGVC